MIIVTLRKVMSTHSNLRTDEVVGQANALPVVGEGFIMFADSLEVKGGTRYIRTTPVVTVWNETGVRSTHFRTANSTYELTVHDEA